MTDRINGCYVTFDGPIREDDCRAILDAIMQIKKVIGVTPFVDSATDWMVRAQIRNEYHRKILDCFEEENNE
jgi:hypothetical protein